MWDCERRGRMGGVAWPQGGWGARASRDDRGDGALGEGATGGARPRMCHPMSSVGSSEMAASASWRILLHSCTFCLLFFVKRARRPELNATAR